MQTSTVSGELSTSTMTYTPRSEDHGKTLHCRATNPEMHRGVLEDQWKLDVQCKLFFVTIQRCVLYFVDFDKAVVFVFLKEKVVRSLFLFLKNFNPKLYSELLLLLVYLNNNCISTYQAKVMR